jgi:hypothetical protein
MYNNVNLLAKRITCGNEKSRRELEDSQTALRSATNDHERGKYGVVVNMKMGDVLASHKEWRDKREKDGQ